MDNFSDRLKMKLGKLAPQRIRRFVNRPIGYGTVVGILLVTLVMTGLFWKVQSPEAQQYAAMSLSLSEFKFFDAKLDGILESSQGLGAVDTMGLLVSTSVLRELGRGVSVAVSDELARGGWAPDSLSGELDRALNVKLMRAERVLRERIKFAQAMDSLQGLLLDSLARGSRTALPSLQAILQIRNGVNLDPSYVPESLRDLVRTNQRQLMAIQDLRKQSVQVVIDEIIERYQSRMHSIIENRDRVNQVFYFLSILTLLAVLVLIVRIPR